PSPARQHPAPGLRARLTVLPLYGRPHHFGRRFPMTTRSWIHKLFARTPRRAPHGGRQAPRRSRPTLELLEDRLAPAVTSAFNNGALVLTYSGTNNDTLTIQSQNTAANDFKVNASAGTTLDGTAGNSETFTGVTSITVTGSAATGETVTFDTHSQNSGLSGAIS